MPRSNIIRVTQLPLSSRPLSSRPLSPHLHALLPTADPHDPHDRHFKRSTFQAYIPTHTAGILTVGAAASHANPPSPPAKLRIHVSVTLSPAPLRSPPSPASRPAGRAVRERVPDARPRRPAAHTGPSRRAKYKHTHTKKLASWTNPEALPLTRPLSRVIRSPRDIDHVPAWHDIDHVPS